MREDVIRVAGALGICRGCGGIVWDEQDCVEDEMHHFWHVDCVAELAESYGSGRKYFT